MKGNAGLHYAFQRLHHAEEEVYSHLHHMIEMHSSDHEVHHVTRDLALWSHANLAKLADVATNYELDLSVPEPPHHIAHVKSTLSHLVGRHSPPALMLLEDLHELYLRTSSASLGWEMLAQHAQAKRETDILDLASACHPQTLRQIRWANTMLKTLSPQALSSV